MTRGGVAEYLVAKIEALLGRGVIGPQRGAMVALVRDSIKEIEGQRDSALADVDSLIRYDVRRLQLEALKKPKC